MLHQQCQVVDQPSVPNQCSMPTITATVLFPPPLSVCLYLLNLSGECPQHNTNIILHDPLRAWALDTRQLNRLKGQVTFIDERTTRSTGYSTIIFPPPLYHWVPIRAPGKIESALPSVTPSTRDHTHRWVCSCVSTPCVFLIHNSWHASVRLASAFDLTAADIALQAWAVCFLYRTSGEYHPQESINNWRHFTPPTLRF